MTSCKQGNVSEVPGIGETMNGAATPKAWLRRPREVLEALEVDPDRGSRRTRHSPVID
jgi:hypothetical protein